MRFHFNQSNSMAVQSPTRRQAERAMAAAAWRQRQPLLLLLAALALAARLGGAFVPRQPPTGNAALLLSRRQQQQQQQQRSAPIRPAAAVRLYATTEEGEGACGCGHHHACQHGQHGHEQQQQQTSSRNRARLPLPWRRWRSSRQAASASEEKEVEIEAGAGGKGLVSRMKFASGLVLAAIGPNPWDRGMGINPTPASPLAIWGPYVFTLLFLTFGMRGLEPLKRFLYDRQKRRKQAKKNAAKPKKKAYYRTPSRLYDTMKKKMEAAQTQEAQDAQPAAQAATEGSAGDEGGNEEAEEEEEEEAPLSAYRCEVCSFTIYPARGREFKFFPAGFKCPSCGATKDKFYDLTDPDDPRNQEGAGGGETAGDEEDLGDDDAFSLGDDEDDALTLDNTGSGSGGSNALPTEPGAEQGGYDPNRGPALGGAAA